MWRVVCLFGSRSELSELAPVLRALDARRARIATLHVAACEHDAPLHPLAQELGLRIDRRLPAPGERAASAGALAEVLAGLDPLLERERPHLLIVQGDAPAALAGALCAALRGIAVAQIGRAGAGAAVLWLRGGGAAAPGAVRPADAVAEREAPLANDAPMPGAAPPEDADDAGERIASDIEGWLAAQPARASEAPPSASDSPRSLADFVDAAKQHIAEITPEQARRIFEAPEREGWHFVDVREPDEYAAGHIPGARSFPRGFLEVRADLTHYKRDPWLEDRGRKLILYCGGGHRSALAARTLQEMGFTSAVSMLEGWTGWTQRAYPVEK